jgi:hypothetical protein
MSSRRTIMICAERGLFEKNKHLTGYLSVRTFFPLPFSSNTLTSCLSASAASTNSRSTSLNIICRTDTRGIVSAEFSYIHVRNEGIICEKRKASYLQNTKQQPFATEVFLLFLIRSLRHPPHHQHIVEGSLLSDWPPTR